MESRSIVDLERATCTLDCHIEAATLAEGATFDNDSEQFPVFLLREKNPTRRTLRAFFDFIGSLTPELTGRREFTPPLLHQL